LRAQLPLFCGLLERLWEENFKGDFSFIFTPLIRTISLGPKEFGNLCKTEASRALLKASSKPGRAGGTSS
jgi:hypothetical protein